MVLRKWFAIACASLLLCFPPASWAATRTLVVLGDSLSAGYGLPQDKGWVTLLAERLTRDRLDWRVVNASISGETALGGRNRIAGVLQEHRPAVLILALGSNDGLRGQPLAELEANLTAIVRACRGRNTRVLLAGMRIPPNYGPDYTRRFHETFATVARQQRVPLVPFLLEGIAAQRDFFQEDGMHPNEAAQPRILDNVYEKLKPMLVMR